MTNMSSDLYDYLSGPAGIVMLMKYSEKYNKLATQDMLATDFHKIVDQMLKLKMTAYSIKDNGLF